MKSQELKWPGTRWLQYDGKIYINYCGPFTLVYSNTKDFLVRINNVTIFQKELKGFSEAERFLINFKNAISKGQLPNFMSHGKKGRDNKANNDKRAA